MKKLLRLVGLACAAALHLPSSAISVGIPITYTKLVWSFSTSAPAFANCTQIVMDATGDVVTSDYLVLSGSLICGNGAFVVYGAGYFTRSGSLTLTFGHGGYLTTCSRIIGFSGSCNTTDGPGALRGTGFIRLQ
jgi:hypothetical protein